MREPFALLLERDAESLLQSRDGLAEIERCDQIRPLPRGDRHEHDALTVACDEIPAERAEEVIAHAYPVSLPPCQNFCNLTKMAHGRGSEVRQGEL